MLEFLFHSAGAKVGIIVAVVLAALLLLYLGYKSIQKNRIRLNAPENFVTEAAPIESREAEIADKQVVLNQTRLDTILPDHRIDYLVSFRFVNGTQKTIRVAEEIYDRVSIAEAGEVVIQNDVVLDFIAKEEREG